MSRTALFRSNLLEIFRRTPVCDANRPSPVNLALGPIKFGWLLGGALFENLESGARVEEFLEWFPGVSREQAEAVLEHAVHSLLVA